MKKALQIITVVLVFVAGLGVALMFVNNDAPSPVVTNFMECATAGYPILETYPEQCRTPDGRSFTKFMTVGEAGFGSVVTLRVNEQVKFDDGLVVTLVEVNDSRCKDGVVCIWAGELSSRLILLGGDISEFKEVRLGTETAKSTTESGYTVTLLDATESASSITVKKESEQVVCTMDAKLCPDGSYVGRVGPKCEFTPCHSAGLNCTKNSDCTSSKYICEETQGSGTACPSSNPSCIPTHTTIAGVCKLKEGNTCKTDSDCVAGNLCNKNICTSPVGRACSGPSDTSCPSNFECVQGCGPPVVQYPNDTPPAYFCQLKDYFRPCPICLAKNTLIDTSLGAVPVQNIQTGAPVWTVNTSGERIVGFVLKTSKTSVPLNHMMVELILDDGRTLFVSPGHPTIDGRTVGELNLGNMYDGARVVATNRIPYDDGYTYDILVTGKTGFYYANGILLGSTIR